MSDFDEIALTNDGSRGPKARGATQRRRSIPEVIQTSGMDCGPAALKALLEGLGITVSYGRLREACQTDVDGTSIDMLEEIAKQLGVDAEQVMIPFEQLVHDDSVLPAIAVVRLPSGLTHFVVLWRRAGERVEIMDPATGRRWVTLAQLREELYVHFTDVGAEAWREWAASPESIAVLEKRLAAIGFGGDARARIDAALADPSWRSIAALDAAVRMVERLVRAGALSASEATRLVGELAARPESMPYTMWAVRPSGESPTETDTAAAHLPPADEESPEMLNLRGVVLVCARGVRVRARTATGDDAPLSADLAAALDEKPTRLGGELWRLLRQDGLLGPSALCLALVAATLAGVFEALLFRGFLDVGRQLGVVGQRLSALVGLLAFLVLLALLEAPILGGVQGLGRRLEARLRMAFLAKIPRLGDRYFHSRPVSDMAERSHALHVVRQLPRLASDLVRGGFELLITTLGLIWIDPRSAWLSVAAALAAVALPALTQRGLVDADLRQRSHAGALSRFYLDALLGLQPVRTHGAGRAVRREHESLLVEWTHAGRELLRSVIRLEALQTLLGFGLAGLLLFSYLARAGESASVLLFVYWALNLPVVGQRIALALRQVPTARNVALRMVEPLGAREEATGDAAPRTPLRGGVALTFDAVAVVGGGHRILEDVALTIAPGEHVAIVGPSGAGKSTLVGLLLGWHHVASGRLLVDGKPFDAAELGALRATTAWADPEVQLWNRSLLDNLRYGADPDVPFDLATLLDEAGLRRVLENLPEGLQTHLGEGGGLVSGGEGQRVRFARSLNRQHARLAILDEAFRGHDHPTRQLLLQRARTYFANATLICITHDVSEACAFGRVLVVDGGRIVEDGKPEDLDRDGTRFRALLDAETRVRSSLWASSEWRHLYLERGRVGESSPSERELA